MLTAQYVIVMLAAILGFGINRQMSTVRNEQAGGDTGNILVMAEQPDQVQQRYSLLKTKLLEHSEIEDVTACFQLPGDAIRDAIQLRCEDDDELKQLAILVAGESFIPFFNIKLAAGNNFMPLKMTRREEEQLMWDKFEGNPLPDGTEEYIINRKALKILGIQSPEEATGKMLYLHGFLDYIPKGRICGVVDDFYYNSLHEESIPLLIMQRNLFMHCIMVRFDPRQYDKALESFNAVWNEVNPDFPANYTFMKDVFGKIYRNELNAEKLTLAFSALCLAIASMGLIIFMAFMIKRRTREIGIRKINGASTVEIIRMLNMNFIRWILLAFIIAIPAAFFIMRRWMENFAAKTETSWQVFALAGLSVLLLSLVAVSVQTLRAATANPAEALKSE
jgi:putative ABC transport system permease protein